MEVFIYLWWGFLSESVRLRAGCKVREPLRMNPQCARCGKIVYPTEKVSCLDKVSGRTADLLPARCSLSTPAEGERRRRAVNLAEAQVGVKGRERERKYKKTFLWSVRKCNNKESIVQRGESLGSGAVQFSLNCA